MATTHDDIDKAAESGSLKDDHRTRHLCILIDIRESIDALTETVRERGEQLSNLSWLERIANPKDR